MGGWVVGVLLICGYVVCCWFMFDLLLWCHSALMQWFLSGWNDQLILLTGGVLGADVGMCISSNCSYCIGCGSCGCCRVAMAVAGYCGCGVLRFQLLQFGVA